MRAGPRILIGITGGIAAYKVPQLVRTLLKGSAEIKTVCTPCALRFVTGETLRTVSGHPVYQDGVSFHDIDHIRLAEWADLLLIAPATANTIAKIAHGIADNLLTTLALSLPPEKIALAPAMNSGMWQNKVTQANIESIRKNGITILPVGEGELACSTSGPGRMLEPDRIAAIVLSIAPPPEGPLSGKRVLISSGPTIEPLDPVRVITNRSSGRMGAALASAALSQGARVTVVSGPALFPLPPGARVVPVTTALEMRDALLREFPKTDICILAAAVSDFRPVKYLREKIKRGAVGTISVTLQPNPDIAALLGKKRGKKILAGFALETSDNLTSAKRKMVEKGCDLMILNRLDESLGRDDTRITILNREGEVDKCPVMAKTEAANLIIRRIVARLE
jgi:phosphopantothenoylcysteine decarboxylase/phosphopantothenate--cysteine ligase